MIGRSNLLRLNGERFHAAHSIKLNNWELLLSSKTPDMGSDRHHRAVKCPPAAEGANKVYQKEDESVNINPRRSLYSTPHHKLIGHSS